jgi:hypothetical protein
MLATASPAQNDWSEAMDLARKVKPVLFSTAKGDSQTPYEWLHENYRALGMSATREETARKTPTDPDPLLVQALRREIAPAVFMATTEDEDRPHYSEDPVDLTAYQMKQLEAVKHAAGRAYRIDTQEGRDALRFLHPEGFRDTVREGETSRTTEVQRSSTEEYKRAANLGRSLETLRREAVQRVVANAPFEHNAKAQHIARVIRSAPKYMDKRTGRPASGIVFTNRVEAAHIIADGLNKPVVLVTSPAHSEAKDYPGSRWLMHFDLPHTLHAMNQREGRARGNATDATRLVGHYTEGGQRHKHDTELGAEQVLRGKAPLTRLFRRPRDTAMSDDLTRMFAANRLLKTTS